MSKPQPLSSISYQFASKAFSKKEAVYCVRPKNQTQSFQRRQPWIQTQFYVYVIYIIYEKRIWINRMKLILDTISTKKMRQFTFSWCFYAMVYQLYPHNYFPYIHNKTNNNIVRIHEM